MEVSRREALIAGAAALAAPGWGARGAESVEAGTVEMVPLDYGRSFLCCTALFNSVRFWVESRTRLIDVTAGTAIDFYPCGSCKSENTFAEKDLLKADNYDFLPIFGGGKWLVFRRRATADAGYRSVHEPEELWGVPERRLVEAGRYRELDGFEAIRDATAAALPIVAQTAIQNEETGLRAIIECPVKTMNVSHDLERYQVDTGPVALPDLGARTDPVIDCLRLAFVAFNAPHFADFVVEQRVEAGDDVEVFHYANPVSLAGENRLFALEVG